MNLAAFPSKPVCPARPVLLVPPTFLVLALLILGVGGLFLELAFADDSGRTKTPLDLPSGGSGTEEVEDDSPELITFYGAEFEGNAFFWCLDRSCTMGWNSGGAGPTPLARLQLEMIQAIAQLSEDTHFGIVKFSDSHERWKALPVPATPDYKIDAVTWVQNMTSGGTTCIAPAVIDTLQMAAFSTRPEKRLILVGDGLSMCPPPNTPQQNQHTLMEITLANAHRIPIDTIFISGVPGGIELFALIAQNNDGVFINPD